MLPLIQRQALGPIVHVDKAHASSSVIADPKPPCNGRLSHDFRGPLTGEFPRTPLPGTWANKAKRRAEAAKNPGPVANVLLLFWEGYVVDGDVDLPNLQAGEAFDAPYHVLAQGIRHLMNRPTVHNVYRQIERRLLFANIH